MLPGGSVRIFRWKAEEPGGGGAGDVVVCNRWIRSLYKGDEQE